jgi:RNA-directed DNA polymerase
MTWTSIDWSQCHTNVRRLQARIVKATQEGRWNKVKALQWLLTHSLSAKQLAVRRVTENQGKRTAGVDGETWDTPEAKMAAIEGLKRKGYKAAPLRRVHIPKANGGKRPLGIPTMKDRAMQTLHRMALEPVAETTADGNSYGFRMSRSTADAMEKVHTFLSWERSASWVLEGDIKACFDQISHDWMLRNIPMDKRMLKAWLKAGYVEKGTLFATEAGTPQGGAISPVLANMVLDGLEKTIQAVIPSTTRRGKGAKINFVRYADDFIVTGASQEILQAEIKPAIEAFLAERGLILSPTKTVVTHIDDGFNFLGFNVRKYAGTLLITPRKDNVKRVLAKVRGLIGRHKQATQDSLIRMLNPIIRGWANYYRHKVSKEAFSTVDHAVFEALWRWAKRRHHNKGLRWIKDRYWIREGARNWVFACKAENSDRVFRLVKASDTPIVRHTAVKAAANPFDPAWETYYEGLLDLRTVNSMSGRRQVLALWRNQDGRCATCGEKITRETGWHRHHVVFRSKGGSDQQSNLRLLHPVCHAALHANETRAQPVPTVEGRDLERLEPYDAKVSRTVLRGREGQQ